jgi:LacI family transcriptional regulator
MQRLLAVPEPPTAVLVDNHLAGIGAVHAALHAGCVLGQDLSVIVYDGLGPDSVIRSPITSIDQPTATLVGTLLAELMLARLKGAAPESLQRLRKPALLAGESDGPPSKARAGVAQSPGGASTASASAVSMYSVSSRRRPPSKRQT